MKVLFKLVLALALIVSLGNMANANDRGVNGLIIGGGAGAIMGQVVGRNVESTILGATVGGIIGAVIGSQNSHRHPQKIIIQDSHRGPHHGKHFNHSQGNYSPRIIRNSPPSRGHNYHRNTIIIHKQHRNPKMDHYNNRHPQNRKHHSSNINRRQFNGGNRW